MLPLEPGETIVRVVHRSIFGLIIPAFVSLLLILGGIGALVFAAFLSSQPNLGAVPAILQAGGLILLALGLIWFLLSFILWRRNQLVLTTKHLIDVNALSIFTSDIQRLALDRDFSVQGWTTDIFSAIFGYGRLQVQTGDGLMKLTWDYLPDVQQLVADIEAARQPFAVKETP